MRKNNGIFWLIILFILLVGLNIVCGSIFAEGTISQIEAGNVEVLISDDALGYDAQQDRVDVTPMALDVTFGNMYTKEIEAFGRAVRGECEIPVRAEDGIASQRVIEAAYATSAARTYQSF